MILILNPAEMKILITEDDTLTRKVLEKSIQKAGDCTVSSSSGEDAVLKLQNEIFDVVLIDIHMPGLDGIELIRIIRNELKNNVPIGVITRDKSEEMVLKAFEAGADDFIIKPFDDIYLQKRILKLAAKNE
jgi:DNA-binding response OmpR family regulator